MGIGIHVDMTSPILRGVLKKHTMCTKVFCFELQRVRLSKGLRRSRRMTLRVQSCAISTLLHSDPPSVTRCIGGLNLIFQ